MDKFITIYDYMRRTDRYIPEPYGEDIVQPDLALSPKEIMERWVRNQPLDIMTRNGSFIVDTPIDDHDISEDVWNTEDIDHMDMLEAEEYLSSRNFVTQPATRSKSSHAARSESSGGEAAERSDAAKPSETSDNAAG